MSIVFDFVIQITYITVHDKSKKMCHKDQVLSPVYDKIINIKRILPKKKMNTYWKLILVFGIFMIAYHFKENYEEKIKELENILDQSGRYEILQLIFIDTYF